MRIFVADDTDIVLDLVSETLIKEGHDVRGFTDPLCLLKTVQNKLRLINDKNNTIKVVVSCQLFNEGSVPRTRG